MKILAALAALVAVPTIATAGAPEPTQGAPAGMYSGRWFQIAQILETDHHPCHYGVDEFRPAAKGFTVVMTCQNSPGRVQSVSAHGEVSPGSGGAKFKLFFLGGLIRQEYWMVDRAQDQSWVLMGTPGGNFLWILARTPTLSAEAHAAACARIRALGYDIARLVPDR